MIPCRICLSLAYFTRCNATKFYPHCHSVNNSFFLWWNNILCLYTPHFVYPLSDRGRWGCFPILAIVNNATVNVGMQVALWDCDFIFFRYITRRRITGSDGNSTLKFLRRLHTVFHSGGTNLHSNKECTRVPFSPHPHQYMVFVDSLVIDLSLGCTRGVFRSSGAWSHP